MERWLGNRRPLTTQIAFSLFLFLVVTATGWGIRSDFRVTALFLFLASSVFLALFTHWPVILTYSFASSCATDLLMPYPTGNVDVDIHFFVRLSVFVGASLLVNVLASRLRTAYHVSLEARRAAEDANREKDELIAILSHDLRAPLTSVQLSLQLVERQVKDLDVCDAVTRNTERALEACRRVNGLVHDLLDSAKASAGALSLRKEIHDVSALARSVAEELRVVAAQHGVTLDASGIDGALPLLCDATRISQVVANLVGNSLKFTRPGGTVQVCVESTGDAAKILVSDTGIGMSKEQLGHLFERFWQAERRSRAGVGLGLFIVKAIVDAHGGSISVKSEVNRGTTFCVSLPTSRA